MTGALLWFALAIGPHPMHTTLLELRWDARSRSIDGTLRIFADDLAAASVGARTTPDSYVLKHIELSVGGKPVTLQVCGERRAADAVLFCLRATGVPAAGWRVGNTVLMDRFDDQVNIVRVEKGSASTLLLTRNSSAQPVR